MTSAFVFEEEEEEEADGEKKNQHFSKRKQKKLFAFLRFCVYDVCVCDTIFHMSLYMSSKPECFCVYDVCVCVIQYFI